jgi:two-component system, LuxR family, response regulator FixJ
MSEEAVVHVIDDDEAVRESLSFLLRTANVTVRTYDSALAFLNAVGEPGSGCIIADVRMPDMTGIELLGRLRANKIGIPVIVITGHGDVPLAVEAMKAGAADFLEKPFDDDIILTAVRAALSRYHDDSRRELERAEIDKKLQILSRRELQVLEGLVNGLPNKTIAYEHSISPRTVEVYRANVMTKMQAKSLSELVRMALIGGVLNSQV